MNLFDIEQIIRSKKRKTICIKITDNGKLIIRVPYGTDDFFINKFIEKKRKLIEKKIQKVKEQKDNLSVRKFVTGEQFLFLGNNYKLSITDNQTESIIFDNQFYLPKDQINFGRDIFQNWYKERAFEIIDSRTKFFAYKYGFTFNKIKISNAEKQWGSCSSKKNLNFSWRLIMAPVDIVDYVVVHELCHLRNMNHSSKFWIEVEKILPDYVERKKFLRENGYLYRI